MSSTDFEKSLSSETSNSYDSKIDKDEDVLKCENSEKKISSSYYIFWAIIILVFILCVIIYSVGIFYIYTWVIHGETFTSTREISKKYILKGNDTIKLLKTGNINENIFLQNPNFKIFPLQGGEKRYECFFNEKLGRCSVENDISREHETSRRSPAIVSAIPVIGPILVALGVIYIMAPLVKDAVKSYLDQLERNGMIAETDRNEVGDCVTCKASDISELDTEEDEEIDDEGTWICVADCFHKQKFLYCEDFGWKEKKYVLKGADELFTKMCEDACPYGEYPDRESTWVLNLDCTLLPISNEANFERELKCSAGIKKSA